jgi:hypothetical protein
MLGDVKENKILEAYTQTSNSIAISFNNNIKQIQKFSSLFLEDYPYEKNYIF